MKIDKNTAMHMLVMRNTANDTMYFVQELHNFT